MFPQQPGSVLQGTSLLFAAWASTQTQPLASFGSVLRGVPINASAYETGLGWAPADMITSWAEDGTTVSFPIASLRNLTAITADGAGGDARQVALSLCQTMFEWYNELAAQPEAMKVRLLGQSMQRSGDFDGSQKQTFQFDFYSLYPEDTVADEPS